MTADQKTELNYRAIAVSGANYLSTLIDKRGRFKYRFDPTRGLGSRGYNVLRHCGTIWAMMDVAADNPSNEISNSCRRAALYLLNNFLKFDGETGQVCIVEDNAVKLGGNALALMALLSAGNVIDDELSGNLICSLGEYIVQGQKKDGDFIHKRFFRSGKISGFRSNYYTGEALLALVKLYDVTKEQKILDAVLTCENQLSKVDYGVAEQSHWMLYALEALSRHHGSSEHYEHAKKIARHIVENPDYRDRAMSTPTACRSEGLLAFLRTTPPTGSQTDSAFREACLQTVRRNLEIQLVFRMQNGAFVRGGHDARQMEIRIDYIQHNISSFLHYSRLQEHET